MKRTGAFSLIELMIVAAIVGVLVAMILPAVQRVRESARRVECECRLHQLGLALHGFHELRGQFPRDENVHVTTGVPMAVTLPGTYPTKSTLYIDLLPFLEEGSQANSWASEGPKAVSTYLCPSRRSTDVGAKCDFGYGIHPHAFSNQNPQWKHRYSVMGGVYKPNVTQQMISRHDGLTMTGLLAHKGIEPRHYHSPREGIPPVAGSNHLLVLAPVSPPQTGTTPPDSGGTAPGAGGSSSLPHDESTWADRRNYWQHRRFPGYFGRDTNDLAWERPAPNSHKLLTTPHNVMPVLFADGSVRPIDVAMDGNLLVDLWAWNDRNDHNGDW